MPAQTRSALTRRQALATTALAAFGATLPLAAPLQARAQSAAQRLRALLARSAALDARLDPLAAAPGAPLDFPLEAGMPGGAFVDPLGEPYRVALLTGRREEQSELAAIDRDALPPLDALARDVFAFNLQRTLALFDDDLFDVQRMAPFDPSFGLHVEFPDYAANAAPGLSTPADYARDLARLEGFASYLPNAIQWARTGLSRGYRQPRVLIANVLAQVDAMLAAPLEESPFWTAVTHLPDSLAATERASITARYRACITERVLPGYRAWQAFLRDEYLPQALAEPGRWAMKDGARLYAWELARHTTTNLAPEAIHALGQQEVSRIRTAMERVRGEVGFAGSLGDFFEYVRTNPAFYCKTSEELLGRFAAIEARIWPAIPRLFRHQPKAPFEVRALPALGDQRGTGYYRAGPGDGTTPGVLYFNMAMLGTRPIPTLETLTLHEGIPGHHFQMTLARENTALPDLLKYGSATAFVEGWGLYAESLGPELGLFTDPMQLFGHYDMEMLRAVRLVVDTGLHALRWSRQEAIDFMLANTSMAPRDVAVEVDRYIACPGQACAYKIGELRIRALRERAAKALGARFDIRDYHEQVLGTGCLPMGVLEAKIDTWIATNGRSIAT
ncbi:DUF885 domain-containing protein [Novosphingobium profundi]|uniref:DUF885 domain-containing protein n=1 Tax=Novosphingobium profundi TaxID=1774954 RepID=UPI001BDA2ADF|nr:DUF885 domain-containing protein [Novosphingobium profundi]MBT0670745.1 DUF885 domain-containing protein [Novosphingobium profundi]